MTAFDNVNKAHMYQNSVQQHRRFIYYLQQTLRSLLHSGVSTRKHVKKKHLKHQKSW